MAERVTRRILLNKVKLLAAPFPNKGPALFNGSLFVRLSRSSG